jgi:hypothetical protein
MKPLELKPMMNESDGPMEDSRDIEVTLKRDMFPDGAKFWDDDGTPKVTTPDGRAFDAALTKVIPGAVPPNPYGPFVREVDWDRFVEVIREEYLRIAKA